MASLWDWLWRKPTVALEAGSPAPAKDAAAPVEPIGYGLELLPMGKADRKNPVAIVAAALQAAQESSRQARYADFRGMDTEDISTMLDHTVQTALTFEDSFAGQGFKVESDDAKVEALLTSAQKTADLDGLCEEILRDGLKYGDAFGEPLFSGPILVGVQTYQPSEMFVFRDDKNKLATGKDKDGFPVAYQQKKQGRVVAGWNAWEMVHFKLFPSRKLLYSRAGMLDPIRAVWRKLVLVEQGMVAGRVSRAYQKRIHYVDVTGKSPTAQENTLKEYINRMTRRTYGKKPVNDDGVPLVDVSDDLYIATGYQTGPDGKPYPMLNKTETETPSVAGMAELADVEYLRRKQFAQAPSDIVGIKRNTTGDLDAQDLAYARLVRRGQSRLEAFLRAIFDQVLLANGKLPSTVEYRISFPQLNISSSWRFADARFRASMELRNYAEMGVVPRRWVLKKAFGLSDAEIDRLWAQMEEEATNPLFMNIMTNGVAGAPPPDPNDPLSTPGGAVAGTVNKAGNDGGRQAIKPGSGQTIMPPQKKAGTTGKAVTPNGIDRGTKMGKRLRGNMSGG